MNQNVPLFTMIKYITVIIMRLLKLNLRIFWQLKSIINLESENMKIISLAVPNHLHSTFNNNFCKLQYALTRSTLVAQKTTEEYFTMVQYRFQVCNECLHTTSIEILVDDLQEIPSMKCHNGKRSIFYIFEYIYYFFRLKCRRHLKK